MPVFSTMGEPPAWCELRGFAVLDSAAERLLLPLVAPQNRIVVARGSVQVRAGNRSQVLSAGQFFDAGHGVGQFEIISVSATAQLVHVYGTWGEELGGCGIFAVTSAPGRTDRGDPVDYPKDTGFDSHYHDCDEYWIILEGSGEVVVGGVHDQVRRGDCIATGVGFHHDFPRADAPVTAIYFETTLHRQKRGGHLWSHTHGPALPDSGRS